MVEVAYIVQLLPLKCNNRHAVLCDIMLNEQAPYKRALIHGIMLAKL